ncbi:hypothetical protein COCOR_03438 [Corallococcus coralloides DSM 2259]|uniref:Lipoprotein n=1 Tax=Corallococcus coralloides (strain ATCC 25202 / DSM 2259 / NBRC 100086 / M2) TaxID=1144275 RepID=H8MKH4_CORCM|nr:hypothetical protein [Corallococcus coralloides]AFE05234.1 hypothetical protein COCOR_03438 [Corallococcus coralloides DSM 2259]
MSTSTTKWYTPFFKIAGGSALLTGLAVGALSLPSEATPACGNDWNEAPCLTLADGDVKRAYDGCNNDACRGWADGDYRRHRIQLCHDEKKLEQEKINACWARLTAMKPKYSNTCNCEDPTGRAYSYGANSCTGCCEGTTFKGCSIH